MKIQYYFVLLLSISSLLVSCEKEVTDFREEYAGVYQVAESYGSFGSCERSTAWEEETTVQVSYGSTDRSLIIRDWEFELDENAEYFGPAIYIRLSGGALFLSQKDEEQACGLYRQLEGYRIEVYECGTIH